MIVNWEVLFWAKLDHCRWILEAFLSRILPILRTGHKSRISFNAKVFSQRKEKKVTSLKTLGRRRQ